jgi:hypothetical protein
VLAILASIFVTLYLIVPHLLLQYFFSRFVPLRTFVRSRLEELNDTLVGVGLAAIVCWVVVWYVPPFSHHPFSVNESTQLRRSDYKVLYFALNAEADFHAHEAQFWPAVTRTSRRQARFLLWFYVIVSAEGVLFGMLSFYYGNLARPQGEGKVVFTYYLSPDGRLAELLLTDPERFRREEYTKDRDAGKEPKRGLLEAHSKRSPANTRRSDNEPKR